MTRCPIAPDLLAAPLLPTSHHKLVLHRRPLGDRQPPPFERSSSPRSPPSRICTRALPLSITGLRARRLCRSIAPSASLYPAWHSWNTKEKRMALFILVLSPLTFVPCHPSVEPEYEDPGEYNHKDPTLCPSEDPTGKIIPGS